MRINCRAHVFNAKSAFNKYTVEIFPNRLADVNVREPVRDALNKELKCVIEQAGDYIDEKSFFQNVLSRLSETK